MTRPSTMRRSARKAPGRKASKPKRANSAKGKRGKQDSASNLLERLNRCTAELAEARAQQAATAGVLRVISRSAFDLQPILNTLVRSAIELCNASTGVFFLREGDLFHLATVVGSPPAFAQYMRDNPLPLNRSTGVGRAALSGKVEHIPDVWADPEYQFSEGQRLGGYRTLLSIPLLRDGEVIGVFSLARLDQEPFTQRQIDLVTTCADQAVIAIQNVKLFEEVQARTRELAESLQQQTATSEVLQIISSSPGDLAPVFEKMLENAVRICGAEFGVMLLLEDGLVRPAARYNVPPAFVAARGYGVAYRPPPRSVLATAIESKDVAHAADLRTNPAYLEGVPSTVALVELGGARTVAVVPMLRDNEVIGTITIYRQEVRLFEDKQIELIRNFAKQAVIAIEDARLLKELKARTDDLSESLEQQTATSKVLQVISSSVGELEPVFTAMLESATRICSAPHGTIYLREGDMATGVAHFGPLQSTPIGQQTPLESGWVTGRTILDAQTIHVADIATSDEFPLGRERSLRLGSRAILGVPLLRDGAAIGAILLRRPEPVEFTAKQIELVTNFASQAVIAIENARLLKELRARTDDLSESLQQQTATADVLKVISSSTGDVEPVFNILLENATRVCGAEFGTMNLFEGESVRRVALFNAPAAFADLQVVGSIHRAHPEGGLGIMSRTRDVVQIEDLKTTRRYREGDPLTVPLADLAGARTVVNVPMFRDEDLIGAITIYRQEVRPFTVKQIELLRNFASQAVIAIENARLLNELRQRTDQVAELNRGLEARVAAQVEELGRVGRLKRFLAPQLAELIVSQGDEKILESHRREIVVVFCDLRGYTAFTETAEPEEVLDFLRKYHGALGPLVSQFEGTLDQFSGDGIMVFFNDPVPIPDPAERAVKMAVAMREAASTLIAAWRERGRELGFGAGIAQGYATLGQIGFSERSGYTAIGTVCNVAARLCGEAKDGQILLSQRVNVALKGSVATEQVGALALKGLTQPVVTYNVPLTAGQPPLRVIDGGNH